MSSRIVSILTLSVIALFLGCGSNSNIITAAHAAPPAPAPPTSFASCDGAGSCSGTYYLSWGYCQWETHVQAKTFRASFEIGIQQNVNVSDACEISLDSPITITSITQGNTDYRTYNGKLASFIIDGRACATPACPYPSAQEILLSHKYTTLSGNSMPVNYAPYPNIPAATLMAVFNDDLTAVGTKPTTIHLNFSGTKL